MLTIHFSLNILDGETGVLKKVELPVQYVFSLISQWQREYNQGEFAQLLKVPDTNTEDSVNLVNKSQLVLSPGAGHVYKGGLCLTISMGFDKWKSTSLLTKKLWRY
jgi:hypothetical protein